MSVIVSVSRRMDIPAFYSEWFFNRINAGEVLIRNPFNRNQVSRVMLNRDSVDCFIFWTKNPKPMMDQLQLLAGYHYYFQFTLNSYGADIETKVGNKTEIIETFRQLSMKVGKEKMIWRYDPILLNQVYTKEYHYKWFDVLAQKLGGCTDQCVISFVDDYKESRKNAATLALETITERDMLEIGAELVKIAQKYHILIKSCGETSDLSVVGIQQGQCIDPYLISWITGKDFTKSKEDTMRGGCKCVKSIDIGEYNSCLHYCAYCYANYNSSTIEKNRSSHDVLSPLLLGPLTGREKITNHYLCKKRLAAFEQITLI